MSVKMATPDLLKIKVFWNKGYDVKMSVHDVTIFYYVIQNKKILNRVKYNFYRTYKKEDSNKLRSKIELIIFTTILSISKILSQTC